MKAEDGVAARSPDKNKLFEFSVGSAAPELRVLKLSGNTIVSLDLANVPNIRTVRRQRRAD